MSKNRHGLPRHIPAAIAREVRQRSKFGCVLCRCGFYEYEHIDPPFENATAHEPSNICCLCSSCHSAVTRGQRSKASVAAAYEQIQAQTIDEAGRPSGPLDFYGGRSELSIGGLRYSPLVETVLRYEGEDLIKVVAGNATTPGTISAVFTDETGVTVLELVENAWEGSTSNWDIEVVGPRITVRSKTGVIPLKLRLDPPGVIVIERLDMRIGDSHLLVSEDTYAAGRYLDDDTLAWVYAHLAITRTSANAAAIEFASPEELSSRIPATENSGTMMTADNSNMVLSWGAGCMWIPAGISIASHCGGFRFYGAAMGVRPLDGARRMISRGSNAFMHYLGSGEETR